MSSAARRPPISNKTNERRRPSIQTSELRPVAKRLGKLAVARHRQDGRYGVRQREELRRALQTAGQALNWGALENPPETPVDAVTVDLQRLTRAGLSAIERDLESEVQEKRQEIRQLRRVVNTLSKLAGEDSSAFPVELQYHYTSSRGKDDYVTKTEELTVESSDSAEEAVRMLEKRMDRYGQLRDEMVERLQRRQRVVGEAKAELGEFLRGARPLIGEVLAVLH